MGRLWEGGAEEERHMVWKKGHPPRRTKPKRTKHRGRDTVRPLVPFKLPRIFSYPYPVRPGGQRLIGGARWRTRAWRLRKCQEFVDSAN